MSLINDALKKAQRQRAPDAGSPGASASAGPVAKRAQPLAAKWIVLLALGAVALVVVAAVTVTLFVLSDTPAPPPAQGNVSRAAPVAAASPSAPGSPASAVRPPPSVARPPSPAAPTPSSARGGNREAFVSSLPAPDHDPSSENAALRPPPSAVVPSPSALSSPSSALSPPPALVRDQPTVVPDAPAVSFAIPRPDERIIAYVDRLRVAGIRSSGADSKVLMNDRVYRVGDLVDRELGLKLVQVAPDMLTFEDAKGLTYTKNF